MEMHTEHIEDLAEGYALDALEPGERVRVEEHIAICRLCKQHMQGVHDTAQLLAFAAAPIAPPDRCKLRVMEKVAREQFLSTPTRRQRTGRMLSAWATFATIALIAMGAWTISLQREVAAMQDQQVRAQGEQATLQAQIAHFASTETVRSLRAEGIATGATAKTYMTPGKNEALLVVRNLPRLEPGKAYQVWVARPGLHQPLSVFTANQSTESVMLRTPEPMDTYRWIMVTIEDAQGAQQPSQETVLFGDL